MLQVGVIGYGYWGPNLVRNFSENPETTVSHVCDRNESALKAVKTRYPEVKTSTSPKDILDDDNVQVVAIATPVSTHYPLALEALNAGKHVFIEKPITPSAATAARLINIAERRNLILFVDHTFIYTGAVQNIRKLISSGEMGDIYYFDSVRVNLGLFQHDTNVIWDLAPHDFSIMDYLVNEKPVSVSATGSSRVRRNNEDIAYVTVKFRGGLIAHFHVNWMSPVKIRRIIIGGSRKMVVFDDLNPDERVKVYDKGVTLRPTSKHRLYKDLVQYRIGDMYAPKIDSTEALKTAVAHLVHCVKHGEKPITDGAAGLRVVKLLEASQKSLRKGGTSVRV